MQRAPIDPPGRPPAPRPPTLALPLDPSPARRRSAPPPPSLEPRPPPGSQSHHPFIPRFRQTAHMTHTHTVHSLPVTQNIKEIARVAQPTSSFHDTRWPCSSTLLTVQDHVRRSIGRHPARRPQIPRRSSRGCLGLWSLRHCWRVWDRKEHAYFCIGGGGSASSRARPSRDELRPEPQRAGSRCVGTTARTWPARCSAKRAPLNASSVKLAAQT